MGRERERHTRLDGDVAVAQLPFSRNEREITNNIYNLNGMAPLSIVFYTSSAARTVLRASAVICCI